MNLSFDNINSDPRFPNPPNEIGVPQFSTPNPDYILLIEKINPHKGDYVDLDPRDNPIYMGRDASEYPTLYLVRQTRTPDGKWCFRYWSTDRNYAEQDTWNYSLKYAGENISFPIYARNYIVARKEYKPLARKSRINGLLNIRIISGGILNADEVPTISFGSSSDATAICEICPHPTQTGKFTVSNVYLTSLGTSYTPPVTPVVTVGASGAVSPPVVEAIFQPVNAVLIKEEMQELPEGHYLHSRYVQVIAYYSTIPGPWFLYTRKEGDGTITLLRRRQNWTDEIVPGESYDSDELKYVSVGLEPAEETDFVSWEVHNELDIPDPEGPGNGGTDPGNAYLEGWLTRVYPDKDGKLITEKRRLNVRENVSPGLRKIAGYWVETKIEAKEGDSLLVWEVITYREVLGPQIESKEYGSNELINFAKDSIVTRTVESLDEGAVPDTGTNVISSRVDGDDIIKGLKTTLKVSEWVSLSGKEIDRSDFKRFADGGIVSTSQSRVNTGSAADNGANVISSQVRPLNDKHSIKTTVTASEGFAPINTEVFSADDGQILQSVEEIFEEDDPNAVLTADEKTAGGELINLNNGYVIKKTIQRPTMFTAKRFERERTYLIPPKFRAHVDTVTSSEIVKGTAAMPSPLVAGELQKSEDQLDVHKKRIASTSISIGSSPITYEGAVNYVDRTYGVVSETWSPTAQTADSGVLIQSSEVDTFADGSSVKRTISVTEHPVLSGQDWNNDLGIPIPYTEQYLATATATDPGTSVTIVNRDKYLHRKVVAPIILDTLVMSYPKRVSLPDIPNELTGLSVEWTEDVSIGSFNSEWNGYMTGTSLSLSGAESGNATSSGSLIPSLVPEYTEYRSTNLPGELKVLYVKRTDATTSAAFISAVNTKLGTVGMWPTFKPKSHTIVLKGGKVSVQAQAQASASRTQNSSSDGWDRTEGEGTSYDHAPFQRTVRLPPFIHGAITITNAAARDITVTAEAIADWPTPTNFPKVDIHVTASKTLEASVVPTSLSATSPAAIPKTGLYIIDFDPMPSEFVTHIKVAVTIFDASHLA